MSGMTAQQAMDSAGRQGGMRCSAHPFVADSGVLSSRACRRGCTRRAAEQRPSDLRVSQACRFGVDTRRACGCMCRLLWQGGKIVRPNYCGVWRALNGGGGGRGFGAKGRGLLHTRLGQVLGCAQAQGCGAAQSLSALQRCVCRTTRAVVYGCRPGPMRRRGPL